MSSTLLNAQRLGRFTMSKFAAEGQNNIAYPMQKSFFGKLPSDSIHHYTKNDTTFYFVYLWLPKQVKELGLQLISPVPQFASAWKGDYEAPDYHDSLKVNGKYFDAVMIVQPLPEWDSSANKFMKGVHLDSKFLTEHIDDYHPSETPQQLALKRSSLIVPAQHSWNSLVRIGANENDTAYARAGFYKITIKSADKKKPEGTFVLQVGVTEIIPDLKLFRRMEELSENY
jgi:hypothetical protein